MERPRHWYILLFEQEAAAQEAALVIPGHVDQFIEGCMKQSTRHDGFRYVFEAYEALSERARLDIIELTGTQRLVVNHCY
jgi:hypothetical protein